MCTLLEAGGLKLLWLFRDWWVCSQSWAAQRLGCLAEQCIQLWTNLTQSFTNDRARNFTSPSSGPGGPRKCSAGQRAYPWSKTNVIACHWRRWTHWWREMIWCVKLGAATTCERWTVESPEARASYAAGQCFHCIVSSDFFRWNKSTVHDLRCWRRRMEGNIRGMIIKQQIWLN